ncbi:MAG TPA: type VI secretion system tip protein VgrG, partial [Sorangium sp.]|nr:type VI secretion system tip protein VgrG [Sorangium sp.]
MSHASFRLEGVNTNLTVTATTGEERLGQGHHFELELASDAPVDAAAAIEQPCVLQLQTPFGEGHYHGIVAAITQCATADGSAARRCRLTMTSSLSLLEHSRRRRIFRNKNAAAVVATLMEEAGLDAAADGLSAALVDYPHLTQYDESDRRFIRRLLEQDGLWLRNESDFDSDSWTLCDAVAAAPDLGELLTVDEAHLRSGEACAVDVEVVRRLAPGKVALRGYHADNPNHTLQAEVAAAGDAEETLEVYRSRDQSWGHSATTDEHLRSAAERHLHGLRAEAKLVRWRCNVPLRAGRRLSLTGEVDLGVFIVSVRHHFDHDADTYHCDITATPTGQPYRLPPTTQKPRIDGAAYAVVTGSAGEEIHCDALGRVNVRFTWDRSGPSDHHSSLPVRVLHPNLAGSLLIPRVGWEVLIMFEDGD